MAEACRGRSISRWAAIINAAASADSTGVSNRCVLDDGPRPREEMSLAQCQYWVVLRQYVDLTGSSCCSQAARMYSAVKVEECSFLFERFLFLFL